MATIRIKRRKAPGNATAPATLKNAELAFNEISKTLYYGVGEIETEGPDQGNATSILPIMGDGAVWTGSATFGTVNTTGELRAGEGAYAYNESESGRKLLATLDYVDTAVSSGLAAGVIPLGVDADCATTSPRLTAPPEAKLAPFAPVQAAWFPPNNVDASTHTLEIFGSVTVLSGLPTLFGYTVQAGDRVLIVNHPNPSLRGIWTVTSGAWYRAIEENHPAYYTRGKRVAVANTANHLFAGRVYEIALTNLLATNDTASSSHAHIQFVVLPAGQTTEASPDYERLVRAASETLVLENGKVKADGVVLEENDRLLWLAKNDTPTGTGSAVNATWGVTINTQCSDIATNNFKSIFNDGSFATATSTAVGCANGTIPSGSLTVGTTVNTQGSSTCTPPTPTLSIGACSSTALILNGADPPQYGNNYQITFMGRTITLPATATGGNGYWDGYVETEIIGGYYYRYIIGMPSASNPFSGLYLRYEKWDEGAAFLYESVDITFNDTFTSPPPAGGAAFVPQAGIYIVRYPSATAISTPTQALLRAGDFNNNDKIEQANNEKILVREGVANKQKRYQIVTPPPFTINTTSPSFTDLGLYTGSAPGFQGTPVIDTFQTVSEQRAGNVVGGAVTSPGSVILVKNELNPVYNGLYYIPWAADPSTVAWIRHPLADEEGDLVYGSYIRVANGVTNKNVAFIQAGTGGDDEIITPSNETPAGSAYTGNPDAIFFQNAQAGLANIYGPGLQQLGRSVSVRTASPNRITVTEVGIDLATISSVSTDDTVADGYLLTQVDQWGRVKAASSKTLTAAELRGKIKDGSTADTTGEGDLVFATSPTITSPRMSSTFIADSDGNELIAFPAAVTSAVNEITVTNAATGEGPQIAATGGDTNIPLHLTPKGTSAVKVTSSQASTSTSTGAFVVSGGTGIGGALYVGGATSLAGDVTVASGNALNFSNADAVTAGTNVQGQGALTSDINVITTAEANPSGVTLPAATAGRRVVVVNRAANPVNVYPASGAKIDALTINNSIQILANSQIEFLANSTSQWYSATGLRPSAGTSVLGTSTSSTATPADITATSDGQVLRRASGGLGFGTIGAASIDNNAIGFGKIVKSASAGLSVVGRSANSAGDFAEINAGTDGHVLRRDGTALGFGTIATAGIADSAVTFGKLATDVLGYTTTVTTAGTTTLTNASAYHQFFTGSNTHTVKLPVASTMTLGRGFEIHNNGTAAVTVTSSGSNSVVVVQANQSVKVTCIVTSGTTASSWVAEFIGGTTSTGTGALVYATSPSFTTPSLGEATATKPEAADSSSRVATTDWVIERLPTTGVGTVTSVGLSLPNIFTVDDSPVTTSGTLTGTLVNQSANSVFAGPVSGDPATPAFRALDKEDIPTSLKSTSFLDSITGAVTGAGSSFDLLNNSGQVVTINAFGAAQTVNLGGNATIGAEINLGHGATSVGPKIVNIGTGGTGTSSTTVNIGALAADSSVNVNKTLVVGSSANNVKGTLDVQNDDSGGSLFKVDPADNKINLNMPVVLLNTPSGGGPTSLTMGDNVTGTPGNSHVLKIGKVVINSAGATIGADTYKGAISECVWNGDTIAETKGGTGLSSYTAGDILYASAANTLGKLAKPNADSVLNMGAAGTPQWLSTTGSGKAVRATSPTFTTSVLTNSANLDVFNTTATQVNAFGAATSINIGASSGTTAIKNDLSVAGGLTVDGDLLVKGDTFVIEAGTLQVEDKNIELGKVETPSNTTADGGGITLLGPTGSNKTLIWELNNATPANSNWTSSENFNIASGKTYKINDDNVVSGTAVGNNNTDWAGKTIPVSKGGTGQTEKAAAFDALAPTTTLGDLIYHNGSDNVRLAGSTNSGKRFLTQTGTGSASAAPGWNAIAAADIQGLTLAFSANNTFFNATGQTFGIATTKDSIVIKGRDGGTNSRRVTIETDELTQNRTIKLPNAGGTVVTSETVCSDISGCTIDGGSF